MEVIKINIEKDSKAAKELKKHLNGKSAFHKAVMNGNAAEYAKQRRIKFDTPVEIN